jgi:heme exporter protein C
MLLAETMSARWRLVCQVSPQTFYRIARPLAKAAWAVAAVTGSVGLVMALRVAQSDLPPGEAWRIYFVHVPAAWLSLLLYAALALSSAFGLVGRVRLAPVLALAVVPTGTLMTTLAIWTGALWGRSTAGDWLTWDARLVAELSLLAAYLANLLVPLLVDDVRRAERLGAMVALGGAVNLALVLRSAHYWQVPAPDGLAMASHAPPMTDSTLAALLLTTLALAACCAASVLHRARSIVLERERRAAWARILPEVQP